MKTVSIEGLNKNHFHLFVKLYLSASLKKIMKLISEHVFNPR